MKLNIIKELSDPTLSRDSGAVFARLAPEIVEIVRAYEAAVVDYGAKYEEYAKKLKEAK